MCVIFYARMRVLLCIVYYFGMRPYSGEREGGRVGGKGGGAGM
jgi:hypothetical protein